MLKLKVEYYDYDHKNKPKMNVQVRPVQAVFAVNPFDVLNNEIFGCLQIYDAEKRNEVMGEKLFYFIADYLAKSGRFKLTFLSKKTEANRRGLR